jgi:hypothetical protein
VRVGFQFRGGNVPAVGAGAQAVDLGLADGVHLRRGFLGGVDAEAGEEIRHADDPGARGLKAEEQIPIQGELERGINATDLVPEPPPPEEGFLRDKIIQPEHGVVMRGEEPAADFLRVFIHQDAVSVNHIDLRVAGEPVGDEGQGAGQVEVVGVDPGHDILGPAGSPRETPCDGLGLAAVGRTVPGVQAVRVAADQVARSVGRTTILHDVGQARWRMVQHAGHGFAEEGGLLEGRRHDGEGRDCFPAGDRRRE